MAQTERPNHSGLRPGVDIDMEEAGRRLQIPRAEWDTPAIQELVGFIIRAHELWQDLFNAAADASREMPPPFLDGAHDLSTRYHAAENLVRVILALLQEGLGVWETRQEPGGQDFGYLEEKLRTALAAYGLAVIRKPGSS
jgi:hypothetical protein